MEAGTSPPGGTRVLLAEDQHIVRDAMRLLLESAFSFEVVEASTAGEAVDAVLSGCVDVALLDVQMPGLDGLWALRRIRAARPDFPVLMLSAFDTPEYVRAALDGGANGYILKGATSAQLREAIEVALEGRGVYIHPTVAPHLVGRARPEPGGPPLTDRQRQVLGLLVDGATNEEIAKVLFVSEKTVKSHVSEIFRRLAVSNRTQAVARAIREGLVTRPTDPPAPSDPS